MNVFMFVLGRTSALCEAELIQVLKNQGYIFKTIWKHYPLLLLEVDHEVNYLQLQSILGGTVKIGKLKGWLNKITPESIMKLISVDVTEKFTFSLSCYMTPEIPLTKLLNDVKELLVLTGRKVRYLLPENSLLSSSRLEKGVVEYLIGFDNTQKSWFLGKVLSVQMINQWVKRDLGRPYINAKSGMLPLKVARMLVNLALEGNTNKPLICDPFCGMGTILSEAMLRDCRVIGADKNLEQLKKADANLQWLKNEMPHLTLEDPQMFVSDATHISDHSALNSIDAIVTEPYMGTPFEKKGLQIFYKNKPVTVKMVDDLIKGLEKLYLGAFKDWHNILKSMGAIVIVLPEIIINGHHFFVKKIVDLCEKLGYTLVEGPYIYARPQAIVQRQIYKFRKINH